MGLNKIVIVLDDSKENPELRFAMKMQITTKINELVPDVVHNVWAMRREALFRDIRIIELNMQYDMSVYCKEM